MAEDRLRALERLCEITLDLINCYERAHGSPGPAWERWREKGADGAIVLARTTADVDALVEAAERW